MTGLAGPILTDQQLSDYAELGFLHSLPILSESEVDYFRAELDRTCDAIGGSVPRFNGLHLFFQWALDLATHPRLLDYLEQLMGPNILLTSPTSIPTPARVAVTEHAISTSRRTPR